MAKAKKLPSGSWRVNQYVGKDEDGKRVYKSFTADSKKEAEYMAAEYVMNYKETAKPQHLTVGQAIDNYIDSKDNILSPTTIDSYRRIRRNHMTNLIDIPLANLNSSIIQTEINREAQTVSPKTIRNIYGLLNSTLAVYHPDLRLNLTFPAKKKELKDLPRPADIISAVKDTNVELPVMLALWLGLRLSEIRGLQYNDIKDGYITIKRVIVDVNGIATIKENTKTFESTRKLRLPKYIEQLIEDSEHTSEFIVTASGNRIYKRFQKALKQHDIPQMRFHDLRHLNASIMLQLGIQDKYAMERGGWKSDKVLKNIYQHTFSNERIMVDNKIDDFMQHEMQHAKQKRA